MATNKILALITTSRDNGDLSFANWGKTRVMNELENALASLEGGINTGAVDVQLNPAYASGTLTIAGGSGSVGGSIGGTAKTVTWGTSDTASATALAAAINADATLKTYVTATSALGVVTITALMPGTMGNAIALTASGTGVTASGSGLLTGGTGGPGNSFTC